ncbi:MAG: phytoene desaturase family protein [Weeksellaceae bacterium]
MKTVIIIGSGFSSLTAACYMQQAGYEVTVLEKNEQLGGRASILQEAGFTFDMGPSWYWMPDVFEKFYNDFGKTTSDFYVLQKLSPAYRVFFEKGNPIDIEDNSAKIMATFDSIDPGSGARLKSFLEKAKKNYEIAMQDLVYQPGLNIAELITLDTAKRLPLFIKNIKQEVAKVTQNENLRSILEFPVLFLGAKPSNTPAFYNFMNWADFGLGTWYPQGGMYEVVKAMVTLAQELGVKLKTHEEVVKINHKGKRVVSVTTKKVSYTADIIISGADYAHTESLLEEDKRNFNKSYWDTRTFAPSSLLYYIGLDSPVEEVAHHNLFFDTDFDKHAEEIYDSKIYPSNPLFYANFPSIVDDTLAPKGKATAFFLIPIAVDLENDADKHEEYFQLILNRFKARTGIGLSDKIIYKKSFGVQDFKDRYHACKGNAYGLANTLLQTSILRPPIKNKNLENLFYTGQLTVPGPGVPPAIISGKVVSDYIMKKDI